MDRGTEAREKRGYTKCTVRQYVYCVEDFVDDEE